MNQQTLKKVQGAIISSFIASFYLEELKHTKLFKQSFKNLLNKTIKELSLVEKQYLDKIDNDNTLDQVTSNTFELINWILEKYDYHEFIKIQELILSYQLNPKRIEGIIKKIIQKDEN